VLGIYTGNTLATLTPQPPGGGNPVGVRVQRGVQYQIALDGPYGQYAEFQLTLTYTPPPPNDDFDHAFVIPEFPATIQGTNGFSSMEPGEPQHHFADYLGGYSIWWTWTAPFTGIVTASVRVPFLQVFDVLGVYTGNSVSTLTTITNRTTDATWPAQEGVTYHIAVDGGYSPFILRLLAPPANDDFAQRAQLTGESNSITAYNLGATREAGEPRLSNTDPGGRSVWWSWTAPADGDVRMFVTGNYLEYGELLPMIGVYTGNTLANLAVVASNLYSSQLRFIVRAGVTYQLQIDGSFGRSGEVHLFLRLLPPAPPLRMDLSNLRRLPGGQVQFPILGRADDIVAIEISSDLRTWHELGQRQLSDSPLLFIDTSVPIQPRRFYRLRNLSSERGY